MNSTTQLIQNDMIKHLRGKPVLVRATDAGVHFGYLKAQEGRCVLLENSRRLWDWKIKGDGVSLSGVVTNGLDYDGSVVEATLPEILIQDACEVMLCGPTATKSIEAAPIKKTS